jgi:hypothetical protein
MGIFGAMVIGVGGGGELRSDGRPAQRVKWDGKPGLVTVARSFLRVRYYNIKDVML